MKQVGQSRSINELLDWMVNDGNVRVLVEMSTRVPKLFAHNHETRVSEGRTAFS